MIDHDPGFFLPALPLRTYLFVLLPIGDLALLGTVILLLAAAALLEWLHGFDLETRWVGAGPSTIRVRPFGFAVDRLRRFCNKVARSHNTHSRGLRKGSVPSYPSQNCFRLSLIHHGSTDCIVGPVTVSSDLPYHNQSGVVDLLNVGIAKILCQTINHHQ